MTMTIEDPSGIVYPHRFLAPVLSPIKGTLLDAAPASDGVGFVDSTGLYESYSMVPTGSVATIPFPTEPTLAAPVQAASSSATTGGTLGATLTYRAKITAVNTRGETIASNEQTQATGAGTTNTITWNWGAVSGATGYRVYVTAAGGASNSETFLVQVGTVTTYLWTGTPAQSPTAAAPPTANTAIVPVTKTFGASVWNDGLRCAVYAGVIAKLVGYDRENAHQMLAKVFANKESVALARAIMQNRFIAQGSWSAATDITPAAGAVDPSVGLALLEGHAHNNYGGVPLIHMGRTIGSLVTRNGQTDMVGSVLTSELGTPIAADAGYEFPNNGPTGAAPAVGEQWIYASGAVSIAGSAPVDQSGLDLVETTDSNRFRILRERMYLVVVDQYTAAIRVKVQ